MTKTKIILAAAVSTVLMAGTASAKTCKGIEPNTGSKISISFRGNKKVRFCFGNTCGTDTYSGSKDKQIILKYDQILMKAKKKNYGYQYYF